jgi:abhydrolase domain-containing protein 13
MNKVFLVGVAGVGILGTLVATLGVLWTLTLVAGLCVGFAALLIANQESILYIPVVMGYKRVTDNPEGYRSPGELEAEYRDFYVKTKDGEKIHGWYIHRGGVTGRPVVIFCHENAGNIGLRVHNLVAMSRQLDLDVLAFDYRGYGDSSGLPSEEGLIADTEAVFEFTKTELRAKKILLYGRSLGGAVALQFAARVGMKEDAPDNDILQGVIVENTFTSISDMIGSVFPFLNFSFVKKFCLRLRWESAEWIRLIRCPVLLLSGLADELVPASHMAELHRICQTHKVDAEIVTFPKGTHNDTWMVGGASYWQAMRGFVKRVIA